MMLKDAVPDADVFLPRLAAATRKRMGARQKQLTEND
jgi:hypothetical protein